MRSSSSFYYGHLSVYKYFFNSSLFLQFVHLHEFTPYSFHYRTLSYLYILILFPFIPIHSTLLEFITISYELNNVTIPFRIGKVYFYHKFWYRRTLSTTPLVILLSFPSVLKVWSSSFFISSVFISFTFVLQERNETLCFFFDFFFFFLVHLSFTILPSEQIYIILNMVPIYWVFQNKDRFYLIVLGLNKRVELGFYPFLVLPLILFQVLFL